MKKKTIVDQVSSRIKPNRRLRRWEDEVADEHQQTLKEIKEAWQEGRFGRAAYPAAMAIAKTLNESGISSVRQSGVVRWLRGE